MSGNVLKASSTNERWYIIKKRNWTKNIIYSVNFKRCKNTLESKIGQFSLYLLTINKKSNVLITSDYYEKMSTKTDMIWSEIQS